jgi:hypothetical protein
MYGRVKKQDKMYRPVGGGNKVQARPVAGKLPGRAEAAVGKQMKRLKYGARLNALQAMRGKLGA